MTLFNKDLEDEAILMRDNAKLYEKQAKAMKKAILCQTRKQKLAYGGIFCGLGLSLYYFIFV